MEKIRVIELFAGIGACRKSLQRLGIPHEIVGISEIDKFAIKSYEAMYGKTKNFGDISKIDRLPKADLWMYGFPCQDISVAGRQKGIVRGKTRSGLLYEVERLLLRAEEDGTLPKCLIMENVKALTSKKFIEPFTAWLGFLESLGYTTRWRVLNAADYGIPQHRERVFAVSILDPAVPFVFPEPVPLKHHFWELIEQKVDKKYYLHTSFFTNEYRRKKKLGKKFTLLYTHTHTQVIANALTTTQSKFDTNYIVVPYHSTRKLMGRVARSKPSITKTEKQI